MRTCFFDSAPFVVLAVMNLGSVHGGCVGALSSSSCFALHATTPSRPSFEDQTRSNSNLFNANPFRNASLRPISTQQRFPRMAAVADGNNQDEALNSSPKNLGGIRRIFVLSDLHTDNIGNMSWLKDRCALIRQLHKTANGEGKNDGPFGANDALIIAGDISHDFSTLETTLRLIKKELECHVFFCFGNHEAWVVQDDENEDARVYYEKYCDEKPMRVNGSGESRKMDSVQKLEAVNLLCQDIGVHTKQCLVGTDHAFPVWLLPLESWYDGSLGLPGSQHLTEDFDAFPWTDFRLCRWPLPEFPLYETTDDLQERGRIPRGVTEYYLRQNQEGINEVQSYFLDRQATSQQAQSSKCGLITFSHFLPDQRTLPDWRDLQAPAFDTESWLDHPAAGLSAKFALVAGAEGIDAQMRSILAPETSMPSPNGVSNSEAELHPQHIHVFGHSHRPKDFIHSGVRYVHHPLGSPRERQSGMIDDKVDFKLVWDTADQGAVPGKQLLRYWEEYGGGLQAVQAYTTRRRRYFGRAPN